MSKLKRALQKAKEARRSGDFPVAAEDRASAGQLRESIEKSPTPADRHSNLVAVQRPAKALAVREPKPKSSGVQISYSETEVRHVDLAKLRNKKLVSLFSEVEGASQIKTLRTQILHQLKEMGGNCILVTSANPGEGKTFLSINLGISIAQELDRTVLIVDADLKQPLNGHFDFARDFFCVDVDRGLADYLVGDMEIPELLLNPGIQKLTILPGGHSIENSTELVGSPQMAHLLDEMKNRYKDDRIIIVDSPAVLHCPDPIELSKFVDGVLLVVEEERTGTDQIARVLELLKNRKILGTVLNKSKWRL